ncbi:hypothetical protein HMPREF3104_03680 [Corynebacterium sp. HMSC30G07]|uniref:hypothetical protein n=1 Tax=Corynebacterium sp. HMSC30G07 TaxID=1581072 RepID=UPI0008A3A56C|nr:hypothetical protein [Corynebacterium sp. HMSC30G07]OFT77018.1 hypothetical protein HMPREF3104_03680 [Corynebacterium sp. HMSC30G07]
MKTARVIVSLATAVAVTAGAGTAVAETRPSDQIGFEKKDCPVNDKGEIIEDQCKTKKENLPEGSAKAFDTIWAGLTSSQKASSGEGSSKDAEGNKTEIPGWGIALIVLSVLGAVGAGIFNLFVESSNIRFV